MPIHLIRMVATKSSLFNQLRLTTRNSRVILSGMQKNDPSGRNTPQFVTEKFLEDLTGVRRRTWQKHRLLGRGPRFYHLEGAVRYNLAEVLAWIEAHAAGGEPQRR